MHRSLGPLALSVFLFSLTSAPAHAEDKPAHRDNNW
jgi:hypothetical protein